MLLKFQTLFQNLDVQITVSHMFNGSLEKFGYIIIAQFEE